MIQLIFLFTQSMVGKGRTGSKVNVKMAVTRTRLGLMVAITPLNMDGTQGRNGREPFSSELEAGMFLQEILAHLSRQEKKRK